MTHMDDQDAKHIKDMIRRVMQRSSENQEQSASLDTLTQVVRVLRRGPDYPYDLVPPVRFQWRDNGPKT
jgi:hypothetical protein